MEPFYRRFGTVDSLITDLNRGSEPACQCTGQRNAQGALYEQTYFGSPLNRPFPGFSAVGVERQSQTLLGKALTNLLYVQSDATHITVRVSAESNGIRNSSDVFLPIIE
jgi:hypothetical protein